jgi:hypothetical protein
VRPATLSFYDAESTCYGPRMQFSAPALSSLALSLFVVACGGSSSETPPPLEPDPTSYRYTGPRVVGPNEATTPAPAAEAEPDEDDLPAKPKKAAVGTWGTGKAPAPAVSSESAGQR